MVIMITIAILIIITITTTATVVEITSGGVGKSRSQSRQAATGEILLAHSLGKTPSLGWTGQYLVRLPNCLDSRQLPEVGEPDKSISNLLVSVKC